MAKMGGKRDGAGRKRRSEIERIRTRAWITAAITKIKNEFESGDGGYKKPIQAYIAKKIGVTVRTLQRYIKNEVSPSYAPVCPILYKKGPYGLEIWNALEKGIYDEDAGCERLGDKPTDAMTAWHKLGCYCADYFTVVRTPLTFAGDKVVKDYTYSEAGIRRLYDIHGRAIVSVLEELEQLGELKRLGLDIDSLALEIGVFDLLKGVEFE